MTITIKNVPDYIGIYSIKSLCSLHGTVDRSRRMLDGTVKIKMLYPKDAKKVCKEINETSLLGNTLEATLQ